MGLLDEFGSSVDDRFGSVMKEACTAMCCWLSYSLKHFDEHEKEFGQIKGHDNARLNEECNRLFILAEQVTLFCGILSI